MSLPALHKDTRKKAYVGSVKYLLNLVFLTALLPTYRSIFLWKSVSVQLVSFLKTFLLLPLTCAHTGVSQKNVLSVVPITHMNFVFV